MCQNNVLLKQFTGPFAFLASFQLVFSSLSEIFPERKNWMLWMCWRVVSIDGKSLQRPIKCFYLWGKGTLPIGRGWHLRGKALQEGYVQLRSPPSWTSVSDLFSNFVAKQPALFADCFVYLSAHLISCLYWPWRKTCLAKEVPHPLISELYQKWSAPSLLLLKNIWYIYDISYIICTFDIYFSQYIGDHTHPRTLPGDVGPLPLLSLPDKRLLFTRILSLFPHHQ